MSTKSYFVETPHGKTIWADELSQLAAPAKRVGVKFAHEVIIDSNGVPQTTGVMYRLLDWPAVFVEAKWEKK